VPTPLVLSGGPGSVTYNYSVTNVGTEIMSNIIISDNKCSPINFISGDTNSDTNLDINETWTYSCSTSLTQTTTNTVTVSGDANGLTASDTANATVVVGVALTPPLIHLIKVPNLFLVQFNGEVVYTYTITNPGTEPLSNVSLIDDKCSPISNPIGDSNSNNLLESSETWTYTCAKNLTSTTINTATAQGSANGLTAIDFSIVTVAVNPLALPVTAISQDKESIILNIFLIIIICSSIVFLYSTRRNKK